MKIPPKNNDYNHDPPSQHTPSVPEDKLAAESQKQRLINAQSELLRIIAKRIVAIFTRPDS